MSEPQVQPAVAAGLSQWQRVADTFVAPQKTFDDIRRGNRSWWLPWLVGAVFAYVLFGAVGQKIGIQQVVDNQIRISWKSAGAVGTGDARAAARGPTICRLELLEGTFLGVPAIGLVYAVVISAVLLGTINFVFGGRANFGNVFAVIYYAWLPGIVKVLLGVVVIYAGMAPESFNREKFRADKSGRIFRPRGHQQGALRAGNFAGCRTIWTLMLLSIGVAMVAGSQAQLGLHRRVRLVGDHRACSAWAWRH